MKPDHEIEQFISKYPKKERPYKYLLIVMIFLFFILCLKLGSKK